MTLYRWSQNAAADATADSSINWQEGQAPSSINDSARAMMAATAKFRDDISGAIATGGTSTAYTVASYQVFDSLSHLNGQMIAFTPHATNGATVTLNVDSLGAKPLRSAPGVELPAGVLVQGTPYVALYNNSDQVFYLHGFFSNPYAIPIGASIDFWGTTAPNSSFVLMYGQAISRTTYATLFSLLGTTHGAGDGSTTFNIPDIRGRVVAGKDDMGGSPAGRLTNSHFGAGATLGAVGGGESLILSASQIPTITSAGSNNITVGTAGTFNNTSALIQGFTSGAPISARFSDGSTIGLSASGTNSISVTSNNTGGAAHRTVQPTIIANKLLRII
ncbi:phage tail protein [Bradyrhizobium sp. USDA 10063]